MKNPDAAHITTSVLFPHADFENLKRLKVQYPRRIEYRYERKPMSDCVARLVHLCTLRMGGKPNAEPVFETLIIDELHFF